MLARLAADLLVLLHAGFVVFVLCGGLLALRDLRWAWLHLPAALWGFLVAARGWFCPLTGWENRLRQAAGDAGYEGGFVEHYVLPVLYPPGLTRQVQWTLAAVVVGVNVLIYGAVAWRRLRPSTGVERPSRGGEP